MSLCNCKEVCKIQLAQINPRPHGLGLKRLGASTIDFFLSLLPPLQISLLQVSADLGPGIVRACDVLKVVF